jgi:hypothetical protein
MKQTPDMIRLEEVLRSSKLADGGFMGSDHRTAGELIDADDALLEKAGIDRKQLAGRMQEITDMAIKGLGTQVVIDQRLSAKVDEAKGALVCPWPHVGNFAKRTTTVIQRDTGKNIRWSDLGIHMIGEHGFFEGVGSSFRLEPMELIEMLL